ncbi:hypothetical protein COY95_04270, partial [Candidatus Woesearchaeota archaeon CG_4_10_14_0_8_um_filter_47_5]
MLEAVIFDMDGVIIDSMPLYARAWNTVARTYNIPFDFLKEVAAFNGRTTIQVADYMLKKIPHPPDRSVVIEEKDAVLQSIFLAEVALFPGFSRLHAVLRKKGIKTALASSSS